MGQSGKSETGKGGKPVLLPSRFCYQAAHLRGQPGCDLAGSPEKAVRRPSDLASVSEEGGLIHWLYSATGQGSPCGMLTPSHFPFCTGVSMAEQPHTGSRETLGRNATYGTAEGNCCELHLRTAGCSSNSCSEKLGQEDVKWGKRGVQYIYITHMCIICSVCMYVHIIYICRAPG